MDRINDIAQDEFGYALAYLNYLSQIGHKLSMERYRPMSIPDRPMPRNYGVSGYRARTIRARVETMVRFGKDALPEKLRSVA